MRAKSIKSEARWLRDIVRKHKAADKACGRAWQCACGPCAHARAKQREQAVKP